MDGSHTRRGQPCWYKVQDVRHLPQQALLPGPAALPAGRGVTCASPCLALESDRAIHDQSRLRVWQLVAACVTEICGVAFPVCSRPARADRDTRAALQVGLVACNDYILIESCLFRLLRLNLGGHPRYAQLLELFHEVPALQHALGATVLSQGCRLLAGQAQQYALEPRCCLALQRPSWPGYEWLARVRLDLPHGSSQPTADHSPLAASLAPTSASSHAPDGQQPSAVHWVARDACACCRPRTRPRTGSCWTP